LNLSHVVVVPIPQWQQSKVEQKINTVETQVQFTMKVIELSKVVAAGLQRYGGSASMNTSGAISTKDHTHIER